MPDTPEQARAKLRQEVEHLRLSARRRDEASQLALRVAQHQLKLWNVVAANIAARKKENKMADTPPNAPPNVNAEPHAAKEAEYTQQIALLEERLRTLNSAFMNVVDQRAQLQTEVALLRKIPLDDRLPEKYRQAIETIISLEVELTRIKACVSNQYGGRDQTDD